MSYTLFYENHRVVVRPASVHYLWDNHRADDMTADRIANDIKRHVDNIASVHLEKDLIRVCASCGHRADDAEWRGQQATGNPIECCDEYMVEFITNVAAQSSEVHNG